MQAGYGTALAGSLCWMLAGVCNVAPLWIHVRRKSDGWKLYDFVFLAFETLTLLVCLFAAFVAPCVARFNIMDFANRAFAIKKLFNGAVWAMCGLFVTQGLYVSSIIIGRRGSSVVEVKGCVTSAWAIFCATRAVVLGGRGPY